MPAKILPIVLHTQHYATLQRLARSQERDPLQQARHLLKLTLEVWSAQAEVKNSHATAEALDNSPAGSGK